MLKEIMRFLEKGLKENLPDFEDSYIELVKTIEGAYEFQKEKYLSKKEAKASRKELDETRKLMEELILDLGGEYINIFDLAFEALKGKEEEALTLEKEEERLQLLYDMYFKERKVLTSLYSTHQELTGNLLTNKLIGDTLNKCTEEISGSGINKRIKAIQKLNANLKEIIILDGEISEHQAKIEEIENKIGAEEALLVSSISSNFDRISLYLSHFELSEKEHLENLERIDLVKSTIEISESTLKVLGNKKSSVKEETEKTIDRSKTSLNGYLLIDNVYEIKDLIERNKSSLGMISRLDENEKEVKKLYDLIKERISLLKNEETQVEEDDYENFASSINADLEKYKQLNRHRKEKNAESELAEKKIRRRKNLSDMNSATEMVEIIEEVDSRKRDKEEIKEIANNDSEDVVVDVDERLNNAILDASRKVEEFGNTSNEEIVPMTETIVETPHENIEPREVVVEPIPTDVEVPVVEMPAQQEQTTNTSVNITQNGEVNKGLNSVVVENSTPNNTIDTTDMITAIDRAPIKIRDAIEAKRPQIKGFFEKMMQRITKTDVIGG